MVDEEFTLLGLWRSVSFDLVEVCGRFFRESNRGRMPGTASIPRYDVQILGWMSLGRAQLPNLLLDTR